jgi:hypothetical protein
VGVSRLGGSGHEPPTGAAYNAAQPSLVSRQLFRGIRDVVSHDDGYDAAGCCTHDPDIRIIMST